ncbi:MAG: hypothetical protein K6E18_09050 [Lachnospiraceae bacterium]|nr:hypothetical protein [Lachnospiraceae bacterium]
MGKAKSERGRALESKIRGLDEMIRELEGQKNSVDPQEAGVSDAMFSIDAQIKYLISKKTDAERELEKELIEEEKQEKEEQKNKGIKGAIMVSMMNDPHWLARINNDPFLSEELQAKADLLFEESTFIHVTKDRIPEILQNKEFEEKFFNTKIRHQDITVGTQFRQLIERELINAAIKPSGDAKKDEACYIAIMKEQNGFVISLKKFAGKEKLMEGDQEEARQMREIYELLQSVTGEQKQAQEGFIRSRRRSLRDCGYKAAMVDKEKRLSKMIEAFEKQLFQKLETQVAQGEQEKAEGTAARYSLMREITFDVNRQLKLDNCFMKNSQLREKREMWYIYDKLKGHQSGSVRQVKELIQDEEVAWKKPAKIKELAAGKGAAVEYSADFALIRTQMLLDRINEHREFSRLEEQKARQTLAVLVIHEMIKTEARTAGKDAYFSPYTSCFMQNPCEEKLLAMGKELASTKAFDQMMKHIGPGKVTPAGCIRFLVENMEKDFVKYASDAIRSPKVDQIMGKVPWNAEYKRGEGQIAMERELRYNGSGN